jgi:hypothetical protein
MARFFSCYHAVNVQACGVYLDGSNNPCPVENLDGTLGVARQWPLVRVLMYSVNGFKKMPCILLLRKTSIGEVLETFSARQPSLEVVTS